uniref:Uncharacterized protein n=1 Tax=Ciona intestinalis TaxID=7719 RepID=H2Y2G6_CIOIN
MYYPSNTLLNTIDTISTNFTLLAFWTWQPTTGSISSSCPISSWWTLWSNITLQKLNK